MSRVYWTVLKTSVAERFIYRADFALGTLLRFLPIVTTIFLWHAIYASAGTGGASQTTIVGYSFANMVSYYLFVTVARAFSSMPGLAMTIAEEVRDGTVKKYLLQPIDMLGFLYWKRAAHKFVYYVVAAVPFAILFFVLRGFLPTLPDAFTVAAFVASLGLAFLIGFLIEACIGLAAFWFLEVSSLVWVTMMLNYFLSGHMFPLDLLPAPIEHAVKLLPYQYLAYWPAAAILGRFSHAELTEGLIIQVCWVVGLFLSARLLYARGTRRYSAFGG